MSLPFYDLITFALANVIYTLFSTQEYESTKT